MTTPARPHLTGLLAGFFLAAGIVLAALTVAGAWTRIAETQVVNVTGSARKNVRSDLVIWRASFASEDASLLGAHEKLAADLGKVERFLRSRGVTEFGVAPVQFREITARAKDDDGETVQRRVGFRLVQRIEVSSSEVEAVPRLGTESSALLGEGVALVSDGLEFVYTKAGEAKVEMMAEATRDARLRAEQIATQGNRALHELRAARMGVVQINPLHSGSTSWEGNNDRSSLEKTITATVAATFSLK
jgi:uncharacterized protein